MATYGSFINQQYDGAKWRHLRDELEHETLMNSGPEPVLGTDYVLDDNGDILVPVAPQAGQGATVLYWSDRRAGTIASVSKSGKSLEWRPDKAVRIDNHGMSDSQSYRYEQQEDCPTRTYTLRKNGRWVLKGDSMRSGQSLAIGIRDEHYDYSF